MVYNHDIQDDPMSNQLRPFDTQHDFQDHIEICRSWHHDNYETDFRRTGLEHDANVHDNDP